jgi:hypothetical protein
MSLSNPRTIFGVHSVTPYSRTDGTFYGIIKVLKSSSLSMQGSPQELTGGSQKFPWAVEDGPLKAEMSLKFDQFEDFMFTLFLGIAPTPVTTEATGNVSTLTNNKGSSVKDASTGIASALALSGSEADLKFGKVIVVCTGSATVDVYMSSDVDFGRGTNETFLNDSLKIASALTITASTATDVTGFGFKLTGGSGTIGMTTGDTAEFLVRPENIGGRTVRVGGASHQTFPEFGAIVIAQKGGAGNGVLVELDCFRCKASGMPIGFEAAKFAEADVKVLVLYDAVKDGVFDHRYILT